MTTGFSGRRKYSLHLLTTSISLAEEVINTRCDFPHCHLPYSWLKIYRTFIFDPQNRAPITEAWGKFVTLVEIVSLSPSPNQLSAATSDLKRMLDTSSYVPASWVVALTALGFQAGNGRVSRAFWDILISLEKDRLGRLFEGPEGRKLLQELILPFASCASNFIVEISAPEKCEHGTQLATWIRRILSAGDKQSMKANARAILTWVDETQDTSFAPARAWILKGILEGVEAAEEPAFDDVECLNTLVGIAKMQRLWVAHPFSRKCGVSVSDRGEVLS